MHAFSKRLQSTGHVPGTRVGTGDMVVSSEPGAPAVLRGGRRVITGPWGLSTMWCCQGAGEMRSGGEGKGLAGSRGPGASLCARARRALGGQGTNRGVGSASHAHLTGEKQGHMGMPCPSQLRDPQPARSHPGGAVPCAAMPAVSAAPP